MAYFNGDLDVSQVRRGTSDRQSVYIGEHADLRLELDEVRSLASSLEQILTEVDRETEHTEQRIAIAAG